MRNALNALPEDQQNHSDIAALASEARASSLDILHLIYEPLVPQGGTKDFQFGRAVVMERWEKGLADMRAALAGTDWNRVRADATGTKVVEYPPPPPG